MASKYDVISRGGVTLTEPQSGLDLFLGEIAKYAGPEYQAQLKAEGRRDKEESRMDARLELSKRRFQEQQDQYDIESARAEETLKINTARAKREEEAFDRNKRIAERDDSLETFNSFMTEIGDVNDDATLQAVSTFANTIDNEDAKLIAVAKLKAIDMNMRSRHKKLDALGNTLERVIPNYEYNPDTDRQFISENKKAFVAEALGREFPALGLSPSQEKERAYRLSKIGIMVKQASQLLPGQDLDAITLRINNEMAALDTFTKVSLPDEDDLLPGVVRAPVKGFFSSYFTNLSSPVPTISKEEQESIDKEQASIAKENVAVAEEISTLPPVDVPEDALSPAIDVPSSSESELLPDAEIQSLEGLEEIPGITDVKVDLLDVKKRYKNEIKLSDKVSKIIRLINARGKMSKSQLAKGEKEQSERLDTMVKKSEKELTDMIGDYISPISGEFNDDVYNESFFTALRERTGMSDNELRNFLAKYSRVKPDYSKKEAPKEGLR
jgi:hypothetical protein